MRDVAIGYIFISVVMVILWVSILMRKRKLQRKLTNLREELDDHR